MRNSKSNVTNKKWKIVLITFPAIAVILLTLTFSNGITSLEVVDSAYAGTSICIPPITALEKASISNTTIDQRIGDRTLQCSIGLTDGIILVYGKGAIPRDISQSVAFGSIMVHINENIISTEEIGNLTKFQQNAFTIAKEKRSDLKIEEYQIRDLYYGWGIEGGSTAGIVTIEDEQGNVISSYHEPAPSRLYIAKGNLNYSLEGYVALSELVEIGDALMDDTSW